MKPLHYTAEYLIEKTNRKLLICNQRFLLCVYIYIYISSSSSHLVVPLTRISLTLSRHFSVSFIAPGRSSGPHPVSSHSCYMYVRDGRPAFSRAYVGVHRSTSLMSSSPLLQQCAACLVRLTWIVSWWEAGGRIVGALWGVAARTCSAASNIEHIYFPMEYNNDEEERVYIGISARNWKQRMSLIIHPFSPIRDLKTNPIYLNIFGTLMIRG